MVAKDDFTNSIWQLHLGLNQTQVRKEGYDYTSTWLLSLSDITATGALSCESNLTQTTKHLDLKYANDRVNNKKWTSKSHWNTLTQWPELAFYSQHRTRKRTNRDVQSWKKHQIFRTWLYFVVYWQATQLPLKKSGWLMEVVYPC